VVKHLALGLKTTENAFLDFLPQTNPPTLDQRLCKVRFHRNRCYTLVLEKWLMA